MGKGKDPMSTSGDGCIIIPIIIVLAIIIAPIMASCLSAIAEATK